MKIKIYQLFLLLLGTAIFAGCDTSVSSNIDDDPDSGTADFSTFVTVGDSLTAGYADRALYRDGQENSYPAILASSFAEVGGGAFDQPLMPVGATGSLTLTGIGNLGLTDRLMLTGTGTQDSLSPTEFTPAQSTSIDVRVGNGGFENLGVPGAKFYHAAIPGYGQLSAAAIGGGTSNPYFARFSSGDATSMLADAAGLAPTFFILWLGNNDVLAFATSGGTGTDQTGNSDVTTYGSNDITDPGFFTAGGSGGAVGLPNYATVAATLKGAAGKGVLINVPDITTIPLFTAVPHDAIPLDAATAGALNASFAAYNAGVTASIGFGGMTAEEAAARQISFQEGQNRILILDEDLTDLTPVNAALVNIRQATADDYVLLTASPKLGEEAVPGDPTTTWGVSNPLVDADVLTETEVTIIDAARDQINATIEATANADPDLLFFDAEAKLRELNDDGLFYGTGGVTSEFATGGAFSLDGVHPTARGYAVIASEIIKVIEDGFGASLPKINPSEYTTVFYQ
jgi:lysophospholipase L1-like esterase